MARRKSNKKAQETLVDIVEVKDQLEQNQKLILGVGAILVLLVGGFFAYKYGYKQPRIDNAKNAIYMAENQFARDSFALALENPGEGYEGFLDIIDNYGGTPTANTAKYYAGISYFNLGRYDDAIQYLESFNASDDLLPITKFGALGDCYAETNDMGKAKSMYKKAVSSGENEALTPYYMKKLAMLHAREGEQDAAQNIYKQIVDKFPLTPYGDEAKRFLSN